MVGKETSDPDDGRQCPFFEELHMVFTDRANNMQRLLLESEAGPGQAKKRAKRTNGDQFAEDFSEDEDDDANESDKEAITRSSNPRKRKAEREKRVQTEALEKPSRQPSIAHFNTSCSSLSGIQEMLLDFFQQQQKIEIQWRESVERREQEMRLFEQEWRQTMEKLEREKIMIEQAWREKEEKRWMREESRAEKRDALLTTLLNKLIHENHL
ncbi:unnamed protein product [Ilex paraguariensis]|uniref:Transcription factor n=1 Tax=Ilex paraguariensis TaxID=185542 RepID=A0ABC8SMH2_9AQUA